METTILGKLAKKNSGNIIFEGLYLQTNPSDYDKVAIQNYHFTFKIEKINFDKTRLTV